MLEFKNLMPRQITIVGSANKGFIATIGCCICVFTDPKEMANALLDYVNDPEKFEKEYNDSQKTPRGVGLTSMASSEDCFEQEAGCVPGGASGIGMRRQGNINPCSEAPMTERRR